MDNDDTRYDAEIMKRIALAHAFANTITDLMLAMVGEATYAVHSSLPQKNCVTTLNKNEQIPPNFRFYLNWI